MIEQGFFISLDDNQENVFHYRQKNPDPLKSTVPFKDLVGQLIRSMQTSINHAGKSGEIPTSSIGK